MNENIKNYSKSHSSLWIEHYTDITGLFTKMLRSLTNYYWKSGKYGESVFCIHFIKMFRRSKCKLGMQWSPFGMTCFCSKFGGYFNNLDCFFQAVKQKNIINLSNYLLILQNIMFYKERYFSSFPQVDEYTDKLVHRYQ